MYTSNNFGCQMVFQKTPFQNRGAAGSRRKWAATLGSAWRQPILRRSLISPRALIKPTSSQKIGDMVGNCQHTAGILFRCGCAKRPAPALAGFAHHRAKLIFVNNSFADDEHLEFADGLEIADNLLRERAFRETAPGKFWWPG